MRVVDMWCDVVLVVVGTWAWVEIVCSVCSMVL